MISLKIEMLERPLPFMTAYVMVKRTPLKLGTAGDPPKPWTSEWTTPGPSPLLGSQPVPVPLTQLANSMVGVLKLAVSALGAIVKLTGFTTDGLVLTIMSQALNGSIWDTFA